MKQKKAEVLQNIKHQHAKGKKPAVVKKAVGFSATKLNAALKLIENQEIKDKRKLETFKEDGTEFELSDTIEEDANVIKAVKDGKYIKIEAWQYEAMVDWLKNSKYAW